MIRPLHFVVAAGWMGIVTLNACRGEVTSSGGTYSGPNEVVTPVAEGGSLLDVTTGVLFDATEPGFDASYPIVDATEPACEASVPAPDVGDCLMWVPKNSFTNNVAAEACLDTTCSALECPCVYDCNVDGGLTVCPAYFDCVVLAVSLFATDHPDAGAADLAATLTAAQTRCSQNIATPAHSKQVGDALLGCLASMCSGPWLGR